MALKFVVGAAAALILWLGFVGFRRDLRRGVMTLVGSLLGAIMVGFWGERWGESLTERFVGGSPQQLMFIVSSLVFLFCALIVGYGGGTLLGPKERGSFQRRLASVLLGIVNGALISAYLLRFATANDGTLRETIQDWAPARLLHDGLPLLFLIVTVGTGLIVLVRLLLSLGGYAPAAPPKQVAPTSQQKSNGTAPSSAASSNAAAPAQTVGERDVLGKINDALRR